MTSCPSLTRDRKRPRSPASAASWSGVEVELMVLYFMSRGLLQARCVTAFLSSIILSSYIIHTNAIYRVITTTELAGVRGRPASARRPSRRSGCRCCCSSAADPRHQAQAPQRRFRETTNHIRTFIFLKRPVLCQGENRNNKLSNNQCVMLLSLYD